MQTCIMSILRDAREGVNLTREELARLAQTSTSTIARMELSRHIPSGATVARIAAVLDISASDLLTPATPAAPSSATPADGGAPFVSGDAA